MGAETHGGRWSLWSRQVAALFRMELRKVLWRPRALIIYALALLPIVPFAGRAVFLMIIVPAMSRGATTPEAAPPAEVAPPADIGPPAGEAPPADVAPLAEETPHPDELAVRFVLPRSPEEGRSNTTAVYANLFQVMFLPLALFFGCVWTFMNLFRGDILDRVLHHYLLAPLRREVLVAGKYAAGVAGTALVYGASATACFVLAYLPYGDVLGQGRLAQLLAYLGITALACAGYGGVFLLCGLLWRNPVIPALVIWSWEAINFLLPAWLKKLSVVHYLRSLTPVPVADGPLAIIAEPTPAHIAIPGLLLVTAALIVLAARRVRRLEIGYTSE
ncbi:MAG: hypothetical protein KBD01_17320 [Acidobacteria bacterium]|nr:hypothetical protein [Acidobacteriota bacterium]